MISYYIIEISQFDLALLESSNTLTICSFYHAVSLVLLKFVVGMQIIQAFFSTRGSKPHLGLSRALTRHAGWGVMRR